MKIEKNYDITELNTFGVKARAKFFCRIESEDELGELMNTQEFKENPKLFLGGGSNVLFTRDFEGIVVLNNIRGIEILSEESDSVLIKAYGGEVWHDLVEFAVERGYWGIENLSLIPGSVGGAPMQNIGAYGAELKDVFHSLEAVDVETGGKKIFLKEECQFGYRDSVFKRELKDKYFILSITLKLSKKEAKSIKYKVLHDYLEKNNIEVKRPSDVSQAVVSIRRSKLPDPKVIGNAGSFFKNVLLHQERDKDKIQKLFQLYPEAPSFKEGEFIKIPSAWLIEECGLKGKRRGRAGVHDRQALVLVNHGGATGEEIKKLAEEIIDSVYSKFGIKLMPEVNLI